MDVWFQGTLLNDTIKIMDVKRDLLPPQSLQTVSVGGRAGAYLFGRKVEPRTFTVEYMIIDDVEEKMRTLARLLNVDEPQAFVVGTALDRTYYVMPNETTSIDEVLHTGRGKIDFVALDPYAYGTQFQRYWLNNRNASVNLSYTGDVQTFPLIRVYFSSAASFFTLRKGGERSTEVITIGESPRVEQTVVEREQIRLNDGLNTVTPWTKVTSSNFDGGRAQADMVSTGGQFRVTEYGEGTGWKGAVYKRAIPGGAIDDFLVEARFTQRSEDVRAVGRVRLYLLDSSDRIVATLSIQDSDPNNYTNYAIAQIGQPSVNQRTMIDERDRGFNAFQDGILRLRRVGGQFTAYIARVDPSTGRVTKQKTAYATHTPAGAGAELFRPITQVAIGIMAHGESPPTLQSAGSVQVWQVNTVTNTTTQVGRAFNQGDVLTIDMARNRIIRNGVPYMTALNPASRFFPLDIGNNSLQTTSDGQFDFEVNYQQRWL